MTFHVTSELGHRTLKPGFIHGEHTNRSWCKSDATLTITAMPAKHATDDAVNALLMPVNGHLLDFSRNSDHLYRLYITRHGGHTT